MGDTVDFNRSGTVGYITLNRPHVLNAISDELLDDLAAAWNAASKDDATAVIVLRGSGRAFCAGADLKEATGRKLSLADQALRTEAEQSIARAVRAVGKPVLAQVHGYAIGGGCELAMLADIRIASHETLFGFPEIRLGSMVTTGGIFNMVRLVGLSRAFELVYTGEMIDGDRALEIGLINQAVPLDDLEDTVGELAMRIAKLPRLELSLTRRLLYRVLDMDFDAALDQEAWGELISYAGGSRDEEASTAAWRAHRDPPTESHDLLQN